MMRIPILFVLTLFAYSGFAQTLIPYLSGEKYGYADEKGNLIIQPLFSNAKIMVGNAGAVFNGEKWGAVNADGKEILPYEFDDISVIKNNEQIFLKTTKSGQNGLASVVGKILVPANYKEVHFFDEAFLGCNKGACSIYSASGKEVENIEAVSVIYEAQQGVLYAMDSKVVKFYNTKGKAYTEVKDFVSIEALSEYFMIVKTENAVTLISNQGIIIESENAFLEVKAIDLLAKAKTENGWGLANKNGWVLEPKYQDVKRINEQLLAAKMGGKWAVFDWEGKEKSDFSFKRIDKIKGTEKFIKAYSATNWDLYQADGTPTKITNVYALNIKALDREGIPFKQKLWGVTSLDKGVFIEPIYKKVITTESGNYIVVLGDRYGILSPKGKEIIKPSYDRILEKDNVFLASLDYDHSIFDNNGKQLLKQKEAWDNQDFMSKGLYRVKRDKLQGVINGKGEIIVPIEYNKIDTLNGVLIATQGQDKYAFKYNGTQLFEEAYLGFNQKKEWLEAKKNANGYYLYGWYNLKNNIWLFKPEWKSLNAFNNDLNYIGETEENLFGIMDVQGNFVLEPAANPLLPYSKNSDLFLEQTGGGYDLKNLNGEKLYENVFEVINIWHGAEKDNFIFSVIQDKKYGLLNDQGEVILKVDLDELAENKRKGESLYRIKKGEKWGMINSSGQTVIEPKFYTITEVKEGWFLLEENAGDKKYVMNSEGTVFKGK